MRLHRILILTLICVAADFAAASAQEADSMFVSDTARLTVTEPFRQDGMLFPGHLEIPDEMTEYADWHIEEVMKASVSPYFYSTVDIKPYYTAVYSFNGFLQEHYGIMPLTGNLHAFLGRRDMDFINLYRMQSAYMAAGVQMTPWLEINGGGIFGMSMLRDRKPLPVMGGMMSAVITPSENASFMVWGSYMNINAFGPPTFSPCHCSADQYRGVRQV